ncbi:hypothetical protein [Accumulibacter sp.]|uniref:hypothetical protein n=1 Tax=Accumulibacter sp. TaxID=2053492 RepID=UPI00287A0C0F|nr:hypothetical protein [Accumulibacter sp.]MDS4056459.1 hypothetical protein [Accumulibacter sp.]HMW56397.1 hypothetical protein [Accumulibacter sp.]HMW79173.1 hypothetical protein [Accumulibacter sp.]HNC66178.1 hypothetical protein [Thauera aminoaromatica]
MQKRINARWFVSRLAIRCRVSEVVVHEILRTAGDLTGEHLAHGAAVSVPGFGKFHRSGIQHGFAIKAVSFFPPTGSTFSAAGIQVSPLFQPSKRFAAAVNPRTAPAKTEEE